MLPSQNHIPIPHRSQHDELYQPTATAASSLHHPRSVNTGLNDSIRLSLYEEDLEIFDIDDLDGGPSYSQANQYKPSRLSELMPSSIFLDHIHAPFHTTSQWTQERVSQEQAPWDADVMRPSGGAQLMETDNLDAFAIPQRAPDHPYDNAWYGRIPHGLQTFNSLYDTYAGISVTSRDSLRLSRMPSLVTKPSLDTQSWGSPPPAPEIYGASQWPGIFPLSPTQENEGISIFDSGFVAHMGVGAGDKLSRQESLCGTTSITALETKRGPTSSWFDCGNHVTPLQGTPDVVEEVTFHVNEVIPFQPSNGLNLDFQLFDATINPLHDHTYGQPPNIDQNLISSPISPSSSGVTQYTPHPSISSSGFEDLSPSTQILASCTVLTPPSNPSPKSVEAFWSSSQELGYGNITEAAYNDNAYEAIGSGLSTTSLPWPSPQLQNNYATERAVVQKEVERVKQNYNCFVMEDGRGRATTPPLPRQKGKRGGHLSPESARIAAERRKAGSTCSRCRIARVTCDGHNPCGRCKKMGQSGLAENPCLKANFGEIVKSGTLNYISQRNINHFTLDETRRIKIILPETFSSMEFMELLALRKKSFNIRARQASGSLYTLDLEKCYDFLKKLTSNPGTSNGALRTFIDHTLVKTESWHACVKDVDPTQNKTHLLAQWNNMPSRASYDIIPLDNNTPSRPLDPEDESDRQEIMIAAQMSRIICRKLELDGFKALQSQINGMRTHNSTYEYRRQMVLHLGRILVSLRWRMSWWQLLGDGSNSGDVFRDRFVERVEHLTKVLYFYYFALRSRIGDHVDLSTLEGEMSSYPDAMPVFDGFPTIQSIQGFEEWLERGKALVKEANAERRFSS